VATETTTEGEMKMGIERRVFRGTEIRAVTGADGSSPVIDGFGAVFNRHAAMGGFVERILPGAFSKVLKRGVDVCCLFNHDPSQLLGRTSAGTLALDEVSSRGLHYRCALGDTTVARDTYSHIQRGEIRGSSFGFSVNGGDEWDTVDPDELDDDDEFPDEDRSRAPVVRRTIHEFSNLVDCGPVTFPAYQQTSVSARSILPNCAQEFRSLILKARAELADTAEQRQRRADLLRVIGS
jgi:uncharacterized protein